MSGVIASAEHKVRARKALNHAVAAGKVVPQPCAKCGAAKAQAHHHDYSQPLSVEWLCALCHSQLHNQRYPVTKACEACGVMFKPHPTKRKRAKSCSPACRSVLIAARLQRLPAEKTCVSCGCTYRPKVKERRRGVTCGKRTCISAARRATLARAGHTFELSATPVWVRPFAIAAAVEVPA